MNSKYIPAPEWQKLGSEFHDEVQPARFPQKTLRYRNQNAAKTVGLDSLNDEDWAKHFHGFSPLKQNLQKPLALRYHGHQFMHYNPDLGDGRGFLFAQLKDNRGRLLDLGTKGSGQTPWSRRGDGRLTLKGAMREVLATSYLEAHGVNTSKTFSIFETGEHLERGDEPSPTRSAVLTRLSHSHVRIGMFQRWAHLGKKKEMEQLLHYCIDNHYPQFKTSTSPVKDFFNAVAVNLARTTAQWMAIGFVHGVLNTDNINITGESFDYGPYRFLPHYDDQFTAAYFDHSKLYAYGQQPRIMLWNLEQLEKSLKLIDADTKNYDSAFEIFENTFHACTFDFFQKRLGVKMPSSDAATALTVHTINFLRSSPVPFEDFFFDWHGGFLRKDKAFQSPRKDMYRGELFEKFYEQLQNGNAEITPSEYWNRDSAINMYIDTIEHLWAPIDTSDDWSPLNKYLDAIQQIPQTVQVLSL